MFGPLHGNEASRAKQYTLTRWPLSGVPCSVQTRRMLIPGYVLMYPATQQPADDIPGKDSNKPKDTKDAKPKDDKH